MTSEGTLDDDDDEVEARLRRPAKELSNATTRKDTLNCESTRRRRLTKEHRKMTMTEELSKTTTADGALEATTNQGEQEGDDGGAL